MLNKNINHMKYDCVKLDKGSLGTSELASYQQYTRTTKKCVHPCRLQSEKKLLTNSLELPLV